MDTCCLTSRTGAYRNSLHKKAALFLLCVSGCFGNPITQHLSATVTSMTGLYSTYRITCSNLPGVDFIRKKPGPRPRASGQRRHGRARFVPLLLSNAQVAGCERLAY